jgi:hypothetical protein
VSRSLAARLLSGIRARLGAVVTRASDAWRHRPAPGRLAAFIFAALLVAAGAGGIGFQAALPSLLPTSLDWDAVGLLLERDARPGDALVTSPDWVERARQVAPRRVRVLALPRGTTPAPAALEGVRRVWLLSLASAPGFSWQPELDLLARSAAPDPPVGVGRIRVARFELSHPDLPLAALDDRLAEATVTLGDLACTPERAGFRCAGERSEASVSRALVEVNGFARPCLLARLRGDSAPVRITFPRVPVGRALRGNAGLAETDVTEDTPVTVAVRVDDQEAGAFQLEGGGWPSFRVDTTRWAGERHTVSMEVVVPPDQAVCLQAVTLP